MTSPPSFDLLTEPWIPCETLAGKPVLLGLEQTLLQAHELGAVHDESPLVTAMLHRVLLSVLHRAFAPTSLKEWTGLWQAPRLPQPDLRHYFNMWRLRFDLFHPERPFMQVAGLDAILTGDRGRTASANADELAKKAEEAADLARAAPEDAEKQVAAEVARKAAQRASAVAKKAGVNAAMPFPAASLATPAARLAPERSQHSAAAHLLARLPDDFAITPAQAARDMLAFQAYTSGGRVQNDAASRKSGTLRGGAVVLLNGANLRETLLLNLTWSPHRSAEDVPPWERGPTERSVRAPRGLVDTLVWPSRRVLLLPVRDAEGALVVRDVITAAGEDMDQARADSMFGYVKRDDPAPSQVRIDPGRATWRDLPALLDQEAGAEGFRRPAACAQLARLIAAGVLPLSLSTPIELLGLAGGGAGRAAAIRDWRTDRHQVPASLFVSTARRSCLRAALEVAEKVAEALRTRVLYALTNVFAISPHKDVLAAHREHLATLPTYWGALEQRFPLWLEELGGALASELETMAERWRAVVRQETRQVVLQAVQDIGLRGRAIRAGAAAERALELVLAEFVPLPEGVTEPPLELPSHEGPKWSDETGFVDALGRLVRAKDARALAALRRSLQEPRGMAPEAAPYVRPHLPPKTTERQAKLYYLVAALAATHQGEAQGVSLGHAFRRVQEALGHSIDTPTSTSERFEQLLAAHTEDVGALVSISLPLLFERGAIDWRRLLFDLMHWGWRDRPVQRQLARDFYEGAS